LKEYSTVNNLASQKCIPCRGGDPALTESEIADLRKQIGDWQVITQDNILRLQRVFKFKNYAQAVEFTNKIAAIAEAEDHHPLIILEWGKVTVQWWTHVVKGLHKNDFIMAAKTDEIYRTVDHP
jgi:4a-hydroxytetrahydrobiopterin dehydratase